MLNGMNSFNLGTRAANHAGITHAQMQAADDTDDTVYKVAVVELLVAADRASAEKKMDIELTRRKGNIATAQQMDHHHNADYKERQAYKDMMKSARAEFLAKWVPGVGKGHAGLPKEGSGLPAHITAETFVDQIRVAGCVARSLCTSLYGNLECLHVLACLLREPPSKTHCSVMWWYHGPYL